MDEGSITSPSGNETPISAGQEAPAFAAPATAENNAAPAAPAAPAGAGQPPADASAGAPAANWDAGAFESFVNDLDPELGFDPELLKNFGSLAGEIGLGADAAKRLLQWTIDQGESQKKAMLASSEKALRAEWGAAYERRLAQAQGVLDLADKVCGGAFRKAVQRSGLGSDVNFIKGVSEIARALGEDALGMAGRPGHEERSMTPEEFFKGKFKY